MTSGSISTENTANCKNLHRQMRAKDLGRLVGSNIIQTKKNIFMCLNNDGVWTRELKKSMFDVRCSCSDEVMILVNIISNKALNLLI